MRYDKTHIQPLASVSMQECLREVLSGINYILYSLENVNLCIKLCCFIMKRSKGCEKRIRR